MYVQAFPPSGGNWQISTQSGFESHWRGDGRELFYVGTNAMWSVDVVTSGSTFTVGVPHKLFDTPPVANTLVTRYEVAPDGQRFLLNLGRQAASGVPPIRVVVNWATGLTK